MKYLVFSIKLIIILAVFGILNTRYQIPDTAYAEGINLKIQPSNLQIQATSPSDIRAPFTITNQSTDAVTLQVLLKRFRDAGDYTGKLVYSNPKLTTEAEKDSLLKRVQIVDDGFAVTQVTLGPKQQKKLLLRIDLAEDAKKQDLYFSVIFQHIPTTVTLTTNEAEEKETISLVKASISVPVLLSINQDTNQSGFLDEFSGPLALQTGPVPFSIRVKNTGEHFVQAQGFIMIKNMFGQTVGKIVLPKTNILAGSTRALVSDRITDQSKSVQALWDEKFLFGFYTATLTLAVSPDQSLYTRSITFLAFPAVAIIFISAGILIGIFLFHRIKKKLAQ